MDAQEYSAWKTETARSKDRWVIDLITLYNRGEYLFYQGGEDGRYVHVFPSGEVELGRYEGAVPHIGEAIFHPLGRAKVAENAHDALCYLAGKFRQGKLTALVTAIEQPDYAHI